MTCLIHAWQTNRREANKGDRAELGQSGRAPSKPTMLPAISLPLVEPLWFRATTREAIDKISSFATGALNQ